MTKYLLECGYQDIFVCSRKNVGVDHDRWNGFRKAWAESGRALKENDFISLYDTENERNKNYNRMLKFINRNIALFFLSDMFAVEAMHYFQSHGVDIPNELGIAGFDDSPLAKYCYPRLTTVRQDISEKGKCAVDMLIAVLEGRMEGKAEVRQPVKLVKGDSVKKII